MQRGIEALQTQLEAKEIEVTSGAAPSNSRSMARASFSPHLDPEFLKEDAKVVADTVLGAVQAAAKQAKEYNDAEMQKVTSAFQVPASCDFDFRFSSPKRSAMTPAFEKLQKHLKQLPGLGFRSSERIALHLLVEKPEQLPALVEALEEAARTVRRCTRCGNLAEGELCGLCADERRDRAVVCVVEHVPDLVAVERSGAYRGSYHVLHGKLSPIHGSARSN